MYRSTRKSTETDKLLREYRPKTKLGEVLLELRRRYIESGGKLLTEKELFDEEIHR